MTLLDIVFPPVCAGCGQIGSLLCSKCRVHLCYLNPDWNLIELLDLPNNLNHVWSALEYRDVATQLVTQVKYQRFHTYTQIMAEITCQQLDQKIANQHFDAFIPIPLSPSRRNWRGFNQSEKFSQQLSERLNIPTANNILFRHGKNKSQVSKNQQQRHEFADKYYLNPTVKVEDKNLCLVDDVITTGMTLNKAAIVLQSAGANIQCLTFAASISGKL